MITRSLGDRPQSSVSIQGVTVPLTRTISFRFQANFWMHVSQSTYHADFWLLRDSMENYRRNRSGSNSNSSSVVLMVKAVVTMVTLLMTLLTGQENSETGEEAIAICNLSFELMIIKKCKRHKMIKDRSSTLVNKRLIMSSGIENVKYRTTGQSKMNGTEKRQERKRRGDDLYLLDDPLLIR
ncbi:unnamed protein product [Onchocerca flexuosa]|uniref:Secreted protein n=1 Tax=Onchocerca flexuosa TaxID=387005 RepID=A0A183HYD4_9BILA|nr:unnamed protein product [Onchocerca flexuosa]